MPKLITRGALSFAAVFVLLGPGYGFAAATCSIDPSSITINEGQGVTFTGNISGKGRKSYSWLFPGGSPSSSTDNPVTVTYTTQGAYDVTLSGTSSKDGDCQATAIVNVITGSGNQAPILDPIGNKSVADGNDLIFAVTASDPDNDLLILTASNLPSGSNFTDNGDGTGSFSWLGASPAGSYPDIVFTASDDELSDSETFSVTVTSNGTNCTDLDSDGFSIEDGDCGPVDCNDNDPSIYPGALEIGGDGIDQSCNGLDAHPPSENHANLTWADYPTECLNCHDGGVAGNHYDDIVSSTHYKWLGDTPDMVNQWHTPQGKLTNAVNSYCINIKGDWPVCGSCHVGRGDKPVPGNELNEKPNVDCLMCHNADYALSRTRLLDGSMGPKSGTDSLVLDSYVKNIGPPARTNCLKCHAYAGGGDGVKRGDLSSALMTNDDPHFDVHMDSSGANLQCQDCHTFIEHKVIGKGSDIRPTDDIFRGSEVTCTNSSCHTGMDSGSGHAGSGRNDAPDRHVARVACQSCHIPNFAKVLDETKHRPTEIHRDWRHHHDGTDATLCDENNPCPGHPHTEKSSNIVPALKFWNRLSDNYLLKDDANATYDPDTAGFPTSRPLGDINTTADGVSKLTPFKYKTADQPLEPVSGQLVALDTFEYLKGTGNVDTAVRNGLSNMGLDPNTSVEWVTTDTYQMINHGVNPISTVADCSRCHEDPLDVTRNSMLDNLGYALKGDKNAVCNQCHDGSKKLPRTVEKIHSHITKSAGNSNGIGCYFCHDVKRSERGLCDPCDSSCASDYVDNVAYPHVCNN